MHRVLRASVIKTRQMLALESTVMSQMNLRTSTMQKCEVFPRRARIQGSYTCVSLNSRLESNKEEEEEEEHDATVMPLIWACLRPLPGKSHSSSSLLGATRHVFGKDVACTDERHIPSNVATFRQMWPHSINVARFMSNVAHFVSNVARFPSNVARLQVEGYSRDTFRGFFAGDQGASHLKRRVTPLPEPSSLGLHPETLHAPPRPTPVSFW